MKDQNLWLEARKLLEEYIAEFLKDIGIGKCSLDKTPEAQVIISKNKWMGLYSS